MHSPHCSQIWKLGLLHAFHSLRYCNELLHFRRSSRALHVRKLGLEKGPGYARNHAGKGASTLPYVSQNVTAFYKLALIIP